MTFETSGCTVPWFHRPLRQIQILSIPDLVLLESPPPLSWGYTPEAWRTGNRANPKGTRSEWISTSSQGPPGK